MARPAEDHLTRAPLSVLRGPPGCFVPELLAGSITDWGRWPECVWLRAPVQGPENLAAALTTACRHRWWPDATPGGGHDGAPHEVLADTIRQAPERAVVVLEMAGRVGHGVAGLLAALRNDAVGRGVSVIAMAETRFPCGGSNPAGQLGELADPASIGGCGQLPAQQHRRLLGIAGRRAAVVQDVLDATAIWPVEVVSGAVEQSFLCRGLLDRLSGALVGQCTPAQLAALEVCLATGYWHPRLGTHPVQAAQLRPWVVPLEHEWGWLRPIWARALRRHMIDRPARRVGRRDRPGPTGDRRQICSATYGADGPGGAGHPDTAVPGTASVPGTVTAPVIAVRLLGTFELRVDGVLVPRWHGQRGISVLRYLLMRARLECPRDVLLAEFWPEVRPESARNRLQVAVSGLRKALLPLTSAPVIEYAEGSYRISRGCRVDVDVTGFETALHQAREIARSGDRRDALRAYHRAVTIYRGDFAADAPYEGWTLLPRERLRIGYVDALDRLAELQFEAGEVDECIATGHRMVEVEPCWEDAHRLLMRCYAGQGRVYQALRQYDFCCRILRATLDAEPDVPTTRLYRAIRADPRRNPP